MIEEHRHCKKCGKVLYIQQDREGGHFEDYCKNCKPF